ncbi:MAG: hypothetical protein ACEQR4_06055 [Rhodoluna sp.]
MRVKPLIAVPLVAIALAGCSTQQPAEETSTAAAQEQPLFSSDEEALAAAQAAYAKYLEVSDQIARDGGANPERLKGLVSTNLYSEQESAYKDLQKSGLHAGGTTKSDNYRVQDYSNSGTSRELISYVCLDVSENPVINSQGLDVTPSERQSRIPLVIKFSLSREKTIIESSEVWSGTNFC